MERLDIAARALAQCRIDRLNDLRNRGGLRDLEYTPDPHGIDYEDAEAVLNAIDSYFRNERITERDRQNGLRYGFND